MRNQQMKDDVVGLPFQVENLINQMLDKKENVYIRGNYRMRLEAIRDVINKSLKRYDEEMFIDTSSVKRKKNYR